MCVLCRQKNINRNEKEMHTMKNDKAEQTTMKEEYRAIMVKRWNNNQRMVDYCTNKVARFVRLSGGNIITIDKPRIETRFCFGYSDSHYDTKDYDRANNMAHHAGTSADYFKAENLDTLQHIIDTLNGIGRFGNNVPYLHHDGELTTLSFCSRWDMDGKEKILDADRATIIDAYKIEIAAFDKRLNTYLKRYGMTKVNTWSYWRDA